LKAVLHTDGGARGNPGPAGIGVVLEDESGEAIGEIAESIGRATNNVAEYRALIAGLELAVEKGVTDVEILVDSELVVSQMKGEWKIKDNKLKPLTLRASSLLNRFDSYSLRHVRREENADADKLANQGIDQAELDLEQDEESFGQGSLLE
jgi:ribonuclease HI